MRVSSPANVQLGATKPEQLEENVKALDVYKKLKDQPEVIAQVEEILDNKPTFSNGYGRYDKNGDFLYKL